MFNGATNFNQDISRWDVSSVENMNNMFKGAISFDYSVSNWNVSNVDTYVDMFESTYLARHTLPAFKKMYVSNKQYDFSNLSIEEKSVVNEWIVRANTNYQHIDNVNFEEVDRMIQLLNNDAEYRYLAITQMRDDNERCHDRALMSMNVIYGLYIQFIMSGLSDERKAEILVGLGKVEALRSFVTNSFKYITQYEQVEVYLYYEALLKEKLGLVTLSKTMRYGTFGKRLDVSKLEAYIENNYTRYMAKGAEFETLKTTYSHLVQDVEESELLETSEQGQTLWSFFTGVLNE